MNETRKEFNKDFSFIKKFDILMKNKIDFYENLLENSYIEINKNKEENVKLNLKIETLEENLNAQIILNKQFKIKNNSKSNKLKNIKQDLKNLFWKFYEKDLKQNELKKIIENLKNKINKKLNIDLESSNEINKYKIINNNYKNELENLNSNFNNYKINNENIWNELKINNSNLKNKINEMNKVFENKLNSKKNELKTMEEKYKQYEEELNKYIILKKENKEVNNNFQKIKSLNDIMNKKIIELNKDIDIKDLNILKLNKENLSLNQIIIDSVKKISNLNNINDNYYNKIKEYKKELEIINYNNTNSKNDINLRLNEYIKYYEKNNLTINNLEELNKNLTSQISDLNKENLDLVNNKNMNLKIIENLENKIENFQNIINQSDKKENELQDRCFELEKINSISNNTINNIKIKLDMCDSFFLTFFNEIEKIKEFVSNKNDINLIDWLMGSIINNKYTNNDWKDEMDKAFTFIDGIILRIIKKYNENSLNLKLSETIIKDKEKLLFEYRTEINKSKVNSFNNDSSNFNKDIVIDSNTDIEELKRLNKDLKIALNIISNQFFIKNENIITEYIKTLEDIFNLEIEIKYINQELIEINKKLKDRDNCSLYLSRFDIKNKEFNAKNKILENLIWERNRIKTDLNSYFLLYLQRLQNKNDNYNSKKILDENDELVNDTNSLDFEKQLNNNDNNNIKKILNINFINKLINK